MPCQEATAKSAGFIVVNKMPDVCLSPNTPIPYNIIAFLSDASNTSETQGNEVRFQGFSAFNMNSRVTRCYGDHPGVGRGIGSGAVGGWCRPITPVHTVNCNGTKLCRHEYTEFEMNCLGPEGPGNTIGKVIYLGVMLAGNVCPDGSMPSGSNEVLKAETPKEPTFLDKIKDSLKIESVEDAVGLAQRAYELSKVDWSNPAAALGALSGMASRAGLSDIAKAVDIGRTAVTTDWDDPVAAIKAAAGIAGNAYAIDQSMKGEFGFGLTDIAGKIWASPTTLLGVAYGGVGAAFQGVGYLVGMKDESGRPVKAPGIGFGHNGIEFTNNAFMLVPGAVTLGNSIIYHPSTGPKVRGGNLNTNIGNHEQAHTHQAEMLGPFYVPAWLLGAAIAYGQGKPEPFGQDNFMEKGPYGHDTPF